MSIEISWPLCVIAMALIIMKVSGVIVLSWLWVLSPIWLPFAFIAMLLGCFLCYALLMGIAVLIATAFDFFRSAGGK